MIWQILTDIFRYIIEYCTHYQYVEGMNDIQRPLQSHQLKKIVSQEWYYNFIMQFDKKTLFRLVQASNILGLDCLLNLSVLTLALRVRGDNKDEVRKMLNVPSDTMQQVPQEVYGSTEIDARRKFDFE